VTYQLPSIDILDGESITLHEREQATRRFAQEELDLLQESLRERDYATEGLNMQVETQRRDIKRLETKLASSEKQVERLNKDISHLGHEAKIKDELITRRTAELCAAQEALYDAEHAAMFAKIESEFEGEPCMSLLKSYTQDEAVGRELAHLNQKLDESELELKRYAREMQLAKESLEAHEEKGRLTGVNADSLETEKEIASAKELLVEWHAGHLTEEIALRALSEEAFSMADLSYNGTLTMTELRSSLDCGPFSTFTAWITGDRMRVFSKHDLDKDGGLSISELRGALKEYASLEELPGREREQLASTAMAFRIKHRRPAENASVTDTHTKLDSEILSHKRELEAAMSAAQLTRRSWNALQSEADLIVEQGGEVEFDDPLLDEIEAASGELRKREGRVAMLEEALLKLSKKRNMAWEESAIMEREVAELCRLEAEIRDKEDKLGRLEGALLTDDVESEELNQVLSEAEANYMKAHQRQTSLKSLEGSVRTQQAGGCSQVELKLVEEACRCLALSIGRLPGLESPTESAVENLSESPAALASTMAMLEECLTTHAAVLSSVKGTPPPPPNDGERGVGSYGPSLNSDYSLSEANQKTPEEGSSVSEAYGRSAGLSPEPVVEAGEEEMGDYPSEENCMLRVWESTVPYLPSQDRQPLYSDLVELQGELIGRVRCIGEALKESHAMVRELSESKAVGVKRDKDLAEAKRELEKVAHAFSEYVDSAEAAVETPTEKEGITLEESSSGFDAGVVRSYEVELERVKSDLETLTEACKAAKAELVKLGEATQREREELVETTMDIEHYQVQLQDLVDEMQSKEAEKAEKAAEKSSTEGVSPVVTKSVPDGLTYEEEGELLYAVRLQAKTAEDENKELRSQLEESNAALRILHVKLESGEEVSPKKETARAALGAVEKLREWKQLSEMIALDVACIKEEGVAWGKWAQRVQTVAPSEEDAEAEEEALDAQRWALEAEWEALEGLKADLEAQQSQLAVEQRDGGVARSPSSSSSASRNAEEAVSNSVAVDSLRTEFEEAKRGQQGAELKVCALEQALSTLKEEVKFWKSKDGDRKEEFEILEAQFVALASRRSDGEEERRADVAQLLSLFEAANAKEAHMRGDLTRLSEDAGGVKSLVTALVQAAEDLSAGEEGKKPGAERADRVRKEVEELTSRRTEREEEVAALRVTIQDEGKRLTQLKKDCEAVEARMDEAFELELRELSSLDKRSPNKFPITRVPTSELMSGPMTQPVSPPATARQTPPPNPSADEGNQPEVEAYAAVLKAKLSSLHSEKSNLMEARDSAKLDYENIQEMFEAAEEDLKELCDERDDVKEELEELRDALLIERLKIPAGLKTSAQAGSVESEKTMEESREEVNTAMRDLEDTYRQIAELKPELTMAMEGLEETKTQVREIESILTSKQTDLESIESILASKQTDLESANAKLSSVESAKAQLVSEREAAEEEFSRVAEGVATWEEEMNSRAVELEELEDALRDRVMRLEELERELAGMEGNVSKLHDASEEKAGVDLALTEARSELAELNTAMDIANASLREALLSRRKAEEAATAEVALEMAKESAGIFQDLEEGKRALQDIKEESRIAENQLEGMAVEIENRGGILESMQVDIASVSGLTAEHKEEVASLAADVAALEQEQRNIQEILRQVSHAVEDGEDALKAAQEERQCALSDVVVIKEELASMREVLALAKSDAEAAVLKRDGAQSEIQKLFGMMRGLEEFEAKQRKNQVEVHEKMLAVQESVSVAAISLIDVEGGLTEIGDSFDTLKTEARQLQEHTTTQEGLMDAQHVELKKQDEEVVALAKAKEAGLLQATQISKEIGDLKEALVETQTATESARRDQDLLIQELTQTLTLTLTQTLTLIGSPHPRARLSQGSYQRVHD